MPVLPSCITEPLWDQFAALLPDRVDPHPLGCHRRRIPDRTVLNTSWRPWSTAPATSASPAPGCSDRTIRLASKHGQSSGIAAEVHAWHWPPTTG
jgi:hypothetical protein